MRVRRTRLQKRKPKKRVGLKIEECCMIYVDMYGNTSPLGSTSNRIDNIGPAAVTPKPYLGGDKWTPRQGRTRCKMLPEVPPLVFYWLLRDFVEKLSDKAMAVIPV